MNKRVIGITVSFIMTVSLFMSQIFAAEIVASSDASEGESGSRRQMSADDGSAVSGNEAQPVVSEPEAQPEPDPEPEPKPEPEPQTEENKTEENKEEVSGENSAPDNPGEVRLEENTGNEGNAVSGSDIPADTNDDPLKSERSVYTDEPSGVTGTDNTESTVREEVVVEEAVKVEVTEQEWLDEHGVTQNDDGSFDYTDENGDHWEFAPEDPEMYKRVSEPGATAPGPIIKLKSGKQWRRAALGEEQDPYTLILNPDFKYKYPSYFTVSSDETLPDIRCGMDISRYQGEISPEDWRTLKDTYGIEFVFIRAGYRGYGAEGSLNDDVCCGANIRNAYKAGVAVGIYYFSQAISEREAREEAEDCMDVIDGYKDMITLPVVIDYEYSGSPGRLRGAALSDKEHTDIVNAFCDRVEDEGYIPGIYANKSMLQRDMILEDIPEKNHIWMANFVGDDDDDGVYSTSYSGRLSSWQFSSRFTGFGEAEGGLNLMKSSYLDLDLWYGDFPGEKKAEFARHSVSSDRADSVESEEAEAEEDETPEPEAYAKEEVEGVKIVDTDTKEEVVLDSEEIARRNADPMSISNTRMTASDVVFSPRPRAYRTAVRIYAKDGSRLAAGFDYERELLYTYDQDAYILRRTDMWGRNHEELTVHAGDEVDMKRDIILPGAVIRVTATGKGRYEDPENNTVSTTFKVLPEEKKKEEPVEVEALTEDTSSKKNERLLSRLKTG